MEKIDKDIDRQNKLVLASHVEYYSIREEYTALNDKKNAYE